MDWAVLGRQVAALDVRWVVPAAVLSPLCIILLAARWALFLRARGLRPAFSGVLRLLWTGQFFNTFLPGAVGGDVYKAMAVGRLVPQAAWVAGSTVVLDRFCALGTLMLIATVGFQGHGDWFVQVLAGRAAFPAWAWFTALLGTVTLIVAVVWLGSNEGRRAQWAGRCNQITNTLADGLRDWRTLGLAALVSLAIHLANFGVFFCLGRSLDLPIGFGQVLFVMPAVLLAAMLPISINGHGVRELILVGYFRWQGIGLAGEADPAAAAVAVSLLYVANDLLWNLPGGLLLALAKPTAAAAPT